MKPDKSPAYQWYPKDHDTDEDVKLMTYAQEGMFRKLLDHQWLNRSIPSKPDQIARLLGKGTNPRQFEQRDWPAMAMKFKAAKEGRLRNAKLERQRREKKAYVEGQRESGRRGAAQRWSPHRRPTSGNGQPIDTPVGSDSSSSSSSSSSPSPSADQRTPQPPFLGGRLTRKEKQHAERVFDVRFWPAYPKKVGRKAALTAFLKLKPDDALLTTMLDSLTRQSAVWAAGDPRFIPHPATWLNGERWRDEGIDRRLFLKGKGRTGPAPPGKYDNLAVRDSPEDA